MTPREREREGNDLLRHTHRMRRIISMENMRSEMYARNWAQGRLLRTKPRRMSQNFATEFMSITTHV